MKVEVNGVNEMSKQHAIIILIIIENDGDNVSSCCLILECFVWYNFSFHFGSK